MVIDLIFGIFESNDPGAILRKIYNDVLVLRKYVDELAEELSKASATFDALMFRIEFFKHGGYANPKRAKEVVDTITSLQRLVKISEAYDQKEERIVLDIEKKLVRFKVIVGTESKLADVNKLVVDYNEMLADLVEMTKLLAKIKNALIAIRSLFDRKEYDNLEKTINTGLKIYFEEFKIKMDGLLRKSRDVNIKARDRLLERPKIFNEEATVA